MEVKTGTTSITHTDDIVVVRYHPEVENILPADIDETMDAAARVAETVVSEQRLLMVVPSPYTLLSDGAGKRTVARLKEWDKAAIVSHALPQRILGNFLVKFSQSTVRLLKTEEGALYWLREG